MRERRKYVRTDGLVLVNYKVPLLQMEGKSSAYNINGSGVRLTIDKELKSGTLTEMQIYLPGDSQPILAKGEVIWAQRCKEKANARAGLEKEYFYAGIKFTAIDEEGRDRIINYVRRKCCQLK